MIKRGWSCVALLLVLSGPALAASEMAPGRRVQPARSSVVDNSQRIDINNISMVVTNTGSFAFDKATGSSGLEFPKGSGKTAVFAAGLWLGARVAGTTRIAVAEYSDEYGPGSAIGGAPHPPNAPQFKVYKLNRQYDNPATRDAALADYTAGAMPYGAPAVTEQPDGTLNILGDQMTWAVYNDLDPANHTNRSGTTAPLGIEVQQTTFAFNRLGALGNTVFIRYKLINRGANQLDSMYISQWSDPDLGGFTDDLVGSDPALGLGFCYNATNNDEQYASAPPAVGYDFFKGPAGLQMSSFNKYINGTDPNTAAKTYNYMRGFDQDGNTVVNPVTGLPTSFQVPGDPVTGSGWLDTNPADRRLMLSSGPFSMAPGDSQEVVTAIVVGQSKNRLASVALMKFYDTFAQAAFDADFLLPSPPQSPLVRNTPREGKVFLSWDTRAENYNQAPYAFEGYVVYQGASISGPWTRVATFDLNNGITTVLDPDFNEEQGLILPIGKAFGQDNGLTYSIELNQDAVRGGPLHVGQRYYYSVNAYAVGLGEFPQVLESAFNPITVIPQTPAAGTDWGSASLTDVSYTQRNPGLATTDEVTVEILDPDKIVTADWEVGFKPNAGGTMTWYLVRHTAAASDTVVNLWPNFSADNSNPVVDGLIVRPKSFPLGTLARVSYDDVGPNPPGIEGLGPDLLHLHFFGEAADYAANLFGSSLDPADTSLFDNVEIRFTGGAPGQKAYRYLRGGGMYLLQDYVDVPFTVWDIDNNRQLNVGFLENTGTADGTWNPDGSLLGNRELIWVMASDYSPTALPYYLDPSRDDALNENSTLDFQYVVWARSTGNPIDAGDKIAFTLSTPSVPNDQFLFSSTAPNRSNTALARSELSRIKAVPNPYFTRSSYELNQFNRQLKFTHLPARCTVRIFTIGGELIRRMEKNDSSSQLVWDLETDRGLPVGSGIYIFHVDSPGVGTHVGKVAVFMEKERLNNF